MEPTKPVKCLSCVLFLLAMGLVFPGCYNADEVKVFLQKPRAPVAAEEYRILPPDSLLITSTQVPEINAFASQVRPDGKINVPLIGEIYVADRTPKEVEEAIKEASKKYYDEPDASVQITGYNSRRFYVFGEVSRPGPVRWTGCDTLLDVLATAQPNTYAWAERIIVIRAAQPSQGGYASQESLKYKLCGVNGQPAGKGGVPDKEGSVPGGPAATQPAGAAPEAPDPYLGARKMTINLMAMVQHGDMANNILLRPNDIIYVQPDPFSLFARGVEKVSSPFRAMGDGLSDFRSFVDDARWIRDSMPYDGGSSNRSYLINR